MPFYNRIKLDYNSSIFINTVRSENIFSVAKHIYRSLCTEMTRIYGAVIKVLAFILTMSDIKEVNGMG